MLIDSHCHLDRLDLSAYPDGLPGALAAARQQGVHGFLCIAISRQNVATVIDIAAKNPDVHATVGIHPLEFNDSSDGHGRETLSGYALASWLASAAGSPKVIGIGETGLDYYYSRDRIREQQESFAIHLEVAKTLQKPVIVHTRDAREDTLNLIRNHGCHSRGGVLHCFTETWEMARVGLDLGYYVSFSGIITFKNAENLREVVKKVPIDRLLVETDSPYLAPVPCRGKSNEPRHVVEVARMVAGLRNMDYERLCRQTSENFRQLFGVTAM